jgi:hypothetical protein
LVVGVIVYICLVSRKKRFQLRVSSLWLYVV